MCTSISYTMHIQKARNAGTRVRESDTEPHQPSKRISTPRYYRPRNRLSSPSVDSPEPRASNTLNGPHTRRESCASEGWNPEDDDKTHNKDPLLVHIPGRSPLSNGINRQWPSEHHNDLPATKASYNMLSWHRERRSCSGSRLFRAHYPSLAQSNMISSGHITGK